MFERIITWLFPAGDEITLGVGVLALTVVLCALIIILVCVIEAVRQWRERRRKA